MAKTKLAGKPSWMFDELDEKYPINYEIFETFGLYEDIELREDLDEEAELIEMYPWYLDISDN